MIIIMKASSNNKIMDTMMANKIKLTSMSRLNKISIFNFI